MPYHLFEWSNVGINSVTEVCQVCYRRNRGDCPGIGPGPLIIGSSRLYLNHWILNDMPPNGFVATPVGFLLHP